MFMKTTITLRRAKRNRLVALSIENKNPKKMAEPEYTLVQSKWGVSFPAEIWNSRVLTPSTIKESDVTPIGAWIDHADSRALIATLNKSIRLKLGDKTYTHPVGARVQMGQIMRPGGVIEHRAVLTDSPLPGPEGMNGGRRKRTLKKRSRKTRKGSRRA